MNETFGALVSAQNAVEIPFIIVQIGNYTFGHCDKSNKSRLNSQFKITFPNYMESLNITKINGAINTYTLTMTYAITQDDDPNRLEKVFSSVANSRTVIFKYGDWGVPNYIYKEEEAIITKLTTKVNVKNSTITYVVNCTSKALSLTAGSFSFPARNAKPSDVIIELLNNSRYGLKDIFKGMSSAGSSINNFIARDDKVVQIEAKPSIGIFDYISYLVSCMTWTSDTGDKLKQSCYFWSTYDDTSNKYGGTYFKVVRVDTNTPMQVSYNTYEVDIGYPSPDCVMDFNVNNDDSWALLYDYAGQIHLPEYSYHINNEGQLVQDNSGILTASRLTYQTNEATKNWWSLVTQFPITATLTIRGLLRPAMLMSYVKVNTYFYGHKHDSSGLYIITKQQDTINASGYRTVLSLTRVGGDKNYA